MERMKTLPDKDINEKGKVKRLVHGQIVYLTKKQNRKNNKKNPKKVKIFKGLNTCK